MARYPFDCMSCLRPGGESLNCLDNGEKEGALIFGLLCLELIDKFCIRMRLLAWWVGVNTGFSRESHH